MKRDQPAPNPLSALLEGSISFDLDAAEYGFVRWRLVPLGDHPDRSLDHIRVRIPMRSGEAKANE